MVELLITQQHIYGCLTLYLLGCIYVRYFRSSLLIMIKKAPLLFVLCGLTLGCANWFPAAVHEVAPGEYEIRATGNSFISIESMKQKVENKAVKICDGAGYERTKRDRYQSHEGRAVTNGVLQTSYYFTYTLVIECKAF